MSTEYVEEGKNAIIDSFPAYRSNIATATINLSNQTNPDANIPPRGETPPSDDNQSPPQPGEVFQDTLVDGSLGPEMVVIPAGTFQMGNIQGVEGGAEKPVHQVSIASFAIGRHEVAQKRLNSTSAITNPKTNKSKLKRLFSL